jgi:ABC-type sugar transport system ATPase subunit
MPVEEWPTAPPLAAKGISNSYASHRVLSDIDFTLRRGEAVAVIGENGAGKSIAKITAGVIRPMRESSSSKGVRSASALPARPSGTASPSFPRS